MRGAEPFDLGARDARRACLLLHGLTGSPAEVRPVGEALAAAGFRALGPLLPGHGTSPEDLITVTRADLLEAAERALLTLRGAEHVYLCGLSAGAALSLQLAARSYARQGLPAFSAVAFLAPAVEFTGMTWVFAEVLGRLPGLPIVLAKGPRDLQVAEPDLGGTAYTGIPERWGAELLALSREALAVAHRVRVPALIVQGERDRTVAKGAARKLARELGSSRLDVRLLPSSGHVLPLDVDSAEVCRSIVEFFSEV